METGSFFRDLFGSRHTHVVPVSARTQGPTTKRGRAENSIELMRDAIDRYHKMFIRGKIMVPAGSLGYPADLEALVKGAATDHGEIIHFLLKIPVDPMRGASDWGVRTLPQGTVFDVYTKFDGTALDGTRYKDW